MPGTGGAEAFDSTGPQMVTPSSDPRGLYAGPVRSRDTSPEARMVQLEVYRRMTGEQRLALAIEMSEAARCISRAGAAARAEQAPHPGR